MRTQRSGFTLVELLVVSVLTAIALAGVYQTLMVQEKSYEAAGLMIHDRESLRTALGILESELSEISSIGGASIGHSDIAVATADSIKFRAPRKLGFICELDRGARWAMTWSVSDDFETDDKILLFVDNDSIAFTDDRWDTTTVTNASSTTDADCDSIWDGLDDPPLTMLKLDNKDLTGVHPFTPVRAFEYVTYSLRQLPSGSWALARRNEGDATPDYLVDGLAPPGEGLQFEYFTPARAATTDRTQIAEIQITVRTDPRNNNVGVEPAEMTTNIYLRNN